MTRYNDAFTEVAMILDSLEEEDYEKIPHKVIEAIYNNRNLEYEYELGEELDLREQPMLPETKAILFNLFRDYLSTSEQREKIIRMQKEERERNEERKRQIYSNSKIFIERQEEKEEKDNIKNQDLHPIERKKDGFFKKIFRFILNLFNRG